MTVSPSTPLALSGAELFLVACWFFVSLWNTSVGPTGGLNFAAMASVLPPGAVIPVQSAVETVGGATRVFLLRSLVDLRFLALFAAGGVGGYALGFAARESLLGSEAALRVLMGSLILTSTWVPLRALRSRSGGVTSGVGALAAFIGLFTGGVAALISSALDQDPMRHRERIATLSACLIYQHGVKLVAFGAFGFSFAAYSTLVLAMIAAAVGGTLLGRHLLVAVPEEVVRPVFKGLVTLLGAHVLARGLWGVVCG